MPVEDHLPSLSAAIARQLLFLARADVHNQLLAIVLCLFVGWLLSQWLWMGLRKTFPQATEVIWTDAKLPPRQYVAALIQNLSFPFLSLIILNSMQLLFTIPGWTRGLLGVAIQLMGVYFVYCLFLVSLYAVFPLAKVRQYRFRLFTPLFFIFVLARILDLYEDLGQIVQISPFKLFNSPITLGDIFLLTAGLYFWIITVTLLEYLFLPFIHTGTPSETGAAASLLLIRYFLIALGIVIILGYVGVNGTALAAITGGLSVGIGFGLQHIISNFVSGILLLLEGALRPGDTISVEGQTCKVNRMGIRATTVRVLADNSKKIIPNQKFYTSDVTTYTGSDRLAYCSIKVGVDYGSNVNQVMDLLFQVADEHATTVKDPAPAVFFIDFGDSSLNFELQFGVNDISFRKRVISDLSCAILEKFAEHHIKIPFPQRELLFRGNDD